MSVRFGIFLHPKRKGSNSVRAIRRNYAIPRLDWAAAYIFKPKYIVLQVIMDCNETAPFGRPTLIIRDCMSFLIAEDGTQFLQQTSFFSLKYFIQAPPSLSVFSVSLQKKKMASASSSGGVAGRLRNASLVLVGDNDSTISVSTFRSNHLLLFSHNALVLEILISEKLRDRSVG